MDRVRPAQASAKRLARRRIRDAKPHTRAGSDALHWHTRAAVFAAQVIAARVALDLRARGRFSGDHILKGKCGVEELAACRTIDIVSGQHSRALQEEYPIDVYVAAVARNCNRLARLCRTTVDARCRSQMTTRFLTVLLLAGSFTAFAQAPRESERRPDAATPIERSQCEALAGVERERCIAEEKNIREQLGRSEPPKKCDELFGPEKELCLKKGGSVKTGAGASGSSR